MLNMSVLNSAPVFEAKAKQIGFSLEEIQRFQAKGWNTYAKFAFSCAYQVGNANEAPLIEVAKHICNVSGEQEVPSDRMTLIRWLFFESYTMAAAHMKKTVESTADAPPRHLTGPERSQRYKEQAQRLSGLSLTGHLECSWALVDLVADIAEKGVLQHVRWDQATCRTQEIMNISKDPMWKPDAQGFVKETMVQQVISADTSTDLLLSYTLQRRALAFDQNYLVRYETFDKWAKVMLNAYLRTPPDRHERVSLEQLQRADMELCSLLMEETRDGLHERNEKGYSILDDKVPIIMDKVEVRLHLSSLPAPQGASQSNQSSSSAELPSQQGTKRGSSSLDEENAKLRNRLLNMEKQIKNLQSSNGRGKIARAKEDERGGKKGGKASARGNVRMPAELVGMLSSFEGQNICFAYNMGGCKQPTEQAGKITKCSKGIHVCCKPGCQNPTGHGARGH